MTEEFKIWIHIERLDVEREEYEDCGLPEPLRVFPTNEGAEAFVGKLVQLLADPDVNENALP